MKSLKSQNYYEILGIPRNARAEEIQQAYENSLQTFQADSMAVYSLFDESENEEIRGLLNSAYETLSDPHLREEYDAYLRDLERKGLSVRDKAPPTSRGTERPPHEGAGTRMNAGQANAANAAEPTTSDAEQSEAEEYINNVEAFSGEVLQKVREMRGLSVEDIAERTKIRKAYVEYLEGEQFDFLPAAVYIKGFVTIIASQLGLPPQKVAEDYMSQYRASKRG